MKGRPPRGQRIHSTNIRRRPAKAATRSIQGKSRPSAENCWLRELLVSASLDRSRGGFSRAGRLMVSDGSADAGPALPPHPGRLYGPGPRRGAALALRISQALRGARRSYGSCYAFGETRHRAPCRRAGGLAGAKLAPAQSVPPE